MVEARQEHWVEAKRVLIYLRGKVEYGLRYLGDGEVKFAGIIGLRLGRHCNRQEEHLRVLL
jgi:hypothetical protein